MKTNNVFATLPAQYTDAAMTIVENAWTEEELAYALCLRYDDEFLLHYDYTNRAVAAVTQGMGRSGFRGPMYAYCRRVHEDGDEGDSELDDMDMLKFAHLGAFFTRYGLSKHVPETPRPKKGLCESLLRRRPRQQPAVPSCSRTAFTPHLPRWSDLTDLQGKILPKYILKWPESVQKPRRH